MTPEKRLESIPPSCQATYKTAMSGHSRAKAIKAFCQECVGYERKLVRNCTDPGCPLFPYRPYQTKKELKEEEGNVEETSSVTTKTSSFPNKKKKKKSTSPHPPPLSKKGEKKKKKKRRTFGSRRKKSPTQ
jgi:hypothetical protein